MNKIKENPVTWNQVGQIFFILLICLSLAGALRFTYMCGYDNGYKKGKNTGFYYGESREKSIEKCNKIYNDPNYDPVAYSSCMEIL